MFEEFLKEVSKYVVVVGSYSREEETRHSDIDFYIRRKPEEVIDYEDADETYVDEIIDIIEKYKYTWTSVIFGHIAIIPQKNMPLMLEFSYHYRIPSVNKIKKRTLFNVNFICIEDDKNCPYEECYDYVGEDSDIGELTNLKPIPEYQTVFPTNE